MPEDMPEDMSEYMPEDMSDRMPEDLPVTKRIDVMVGITRSKVIILFLDYKLYTIRRRPAYLTHCCKRFCQEFITLP